MFESKDKDKSVNVKITDENLVAKFCNSVQISHDDEVFYIDFLSVTPPAGMVISRVAVTKDHLVKIIQSFSDNLTKFEAK